MKSLFTTSFVILLTLVYANAQNDKGDFAVAPFIGLNLATFVTDADATFNIRPAFTAGATGDYYFNNRWSVRTGIIYNPMGAEDDFNNSDKLNYLTIPINANWHFGRNRGWYLNFGPAVSFLLSAESDLSDGTTVDIQDSIRSTDFALTLGIGHQFTLNSSTKLFVDYQGYGGFLDIVEIANFGQSLRNSRSSFNIGLVFTP